MLNLGLKMSVTLESSGVLSRDAFDFFANITDEIFNPFSC